MIKIKIMPLIVATYVCHAARLQCRRGSARTSLGPIVVLGQKLKFGMQTIFSFLNFIRLSSFSTLVLIYFMLLRNTHAYILKLHISQFQHSSTYYKGEHDITLWTAIPQAALKRGKTTVRVTLALEEDQSVLDCRSENICYVAV